MKEKKKNLEKILKKITKDHDLKNPEFLVFLMCIKYKGKKKLLGVTIHTFNENQNLN
jgi:hypothetical protein